MDIEQIKRDFHALEPRANRLLNALVHEIGGLLAANAVALGVPIEGRVKEWSSIEEKLERKSLQIKDVSDLNDLVGVRLILLFRADLANVLSLLGQTFKIVSVEDAALRLGEAQFGYQSQHLILQLPPAWGGIPSLSDLTGLNAEIQVRTVAQHIWAAASHKLQYKQEESVPPPLRRTIYRISALLETVDLELDRVLEERRAYVDRKAPAPDEKLNVDLLRGVLDRILPAENKAPHENYAELLQDLLHFGIQTEQAVMEMWEEHKQQVWAQEREHVERTSQRGDIHGSTQERAKQQVYFTHVGLARTALQEQVGDGAFKEWAEERKLLRSAELVPVNAIKPKRKASAVAVPRKRS